MSNIKAKNYIFFKELFYAITGLIVGFVILEILWNGIILSRINLNWVLIVWMINGIILLRINREDCHHEER